MIALVDCNNFYVSCERVFNPGLQKRPVVVLSNNDGCVISRSDEARNIGIKMAAPYFQIDYLIEKENLSVFSSNYALYGDMSARVMELLNYFSPEVEVYSIDEAFLNLELKPKDKLHRANLSKKGFEIHEKIKKWLGLPVSVGIAPNKTLAKIANRRARKLNLGVFELSDELSINKVLAETPVNEVWGIGCRSSQKLNALGIKTALELKNADRRRVRNLLSVVGARIAAELSGEICLSLELAPPPKKSVTCSRSFGAPVESLAELNQALYEYLVKASEKMRRHKLSAKAVTVFLATSRFAEPQHLYSESCTVELAQATNSTRELQEWATKALERIYKTGYLYKKTGVILHGLLPESAEALRLSGERKYNGEKRLMQALDKIAARFGAGAIRFGVEPKTKKWEMKAEMKSRCYTTCFKDILQVV